jgi:murein DD-endopeptidase MepM/ murein hydrolase activator NlpD
LLPCYASKLADEELKKMNFKPRRFFTIPFSSPPAPLQTEVESLQRRSLPKWRISLRSSSKRLSLLPQSRSSSVFPRRARSRSPIGVRRCTLCRGRSRRMIISFRPSHRRRPNQLAHCRLSLWRRVLWAHIVHTGVDIPSPEGTPIMAAGPGTVVWTGLGLVPRNARRPNRSLRAGGCHPP